MTDRKLLFSVTIHDCEVQTFRSGGKGGQNQNKVASGVRIIHRPSGAVGESRETRSQLENKRRAFVRMAQTERFQLWNKIQASKILGTWVDFEKQIDESLANQNNLKIEVRDEEGKWTDYQRDTIP
jgi:hypothetical protein